MSFVVIFINMTANKEERKIKHIKTEFAPYKEYLWGLIRIKDGWKDIGKQIAFETGRKIPYSFSIYGQRYSGVEEEKRLWICPFDRSEYRLGIIKKTGQVFHHCELCNRWATVNRTTRKGKE